MASKQPENPPISLEDQLKNIRMSAVKTLKKIFDQKNILISVQEFKSFETEVITALSSRDNSFALQNYEVLFWTKAKEKWPVVKDYENALITASNPQGTLFHRQSA